MSCNWNSVISVESNCNCDIISIKFFPEKDSSLFLISQHSSLNVLSMSVVYSHCFVCDNISTCINWKTTVPYSECALNCLHPHCKSSIQYHPKCYALLLLLLRIRNCQMNFNRHHCSICCCCHWCPAWNHVYLCTLKSVKCQSHCCLLLLL